VWRWRLAGSAVFAIPCCDYFIDRAVTYAQYLVSKGSGVLLIALPEQQKGLGN
jgi:hypothetical protein